MRLRWLSLLLVVLVTFAPCRAAANDAIPIRLAFVRGGDLWRWGGGTVQQLTHEGDVSFPRFSHNGEWVLYQRGGEWRLMRADGGRSWVVPLAGSAAWSPAALELAVADGRDTYVVPVGDGGPGEARLVVRGWSGTVWSPDGMRLAVARAERTGESLFEGKVFLGIVGSKGGEPRQILQERFPKGDCGGGAHASAWSPDGQWLLLVRYGITASISADCNELAVVRVSGGPAVSLGETPQPRWAVWSPVAPTLAFVDGVGREATRNKRLRLASSPFGEPRAGEPRAGGDALTVTPPGFADRDPAWHPAGHYLAFTRSKAQPPVDMNDPAPGQVIMRLDTRGGPPQPVPGSEGGFGPFWAADGTVFWFRHERGRTDLWQHRQGVTSAVLTDLDLTHSYYGQWNWPSVLDYVSK